MYNPNTAFASSRVQTDLFHNLFLGWWQLVRCEGIWKVGGGTDSLDAVKSLKKSSDNFNLRVFWEKYIQNHTE